MITKCFLFVFAFSLFYQSANAQIESVKKKSDLQWINDSICYDNGNEFTGEVIDYLGSKFDKTKLLYDGHFINGQRNGTIKQWYTSLKIKSIENYKIGRKEGIQTYYYENGKKRAEFQYSRGFKDGQESEWYDNGQLKRTCQYSQGMLLDGTFIVYYENGQKKQESLYSGGIVINEKLFRNDSVIESKELKAEFDPVTKENSKGFLVNNKKDGFWTYWYDGVQKKKEGYYKNGIEEGRWIFWYPDGKVEYEGTCLNGKKDGQGVVNYKDQKGLTYSGELKNDLRDGYGTLRWGDGNINYQGYFKNGKPDGKGTTYDNGKVIYEGEWKDGQRNGKGTWHDYKNGFLISGDWVNGSFTGQGTMSMTDEDGTTFLYSGEFKDMKLFNGTFYMNKPDGSKYTKEYKDGKEGRLKKIN